MLEEERGCIVGDMVDQEQLREKVVQLLRKGGLATRQEMARILALSGEERKSLEGLLEELVEEKLVTMKKKARYAWRVSLEKSLVGVLKYHPKGHAWFFPDTGLEENRETGIDLQVNSRIFVARRDVGTALDGDQVRVVVTLPEVKRVGRDERESEVRGEVREILARRSGKIVGIFHCDEDDMWVECDDLSMDLPIVVEGETTASPGQQVVVVLDDWKSREQEPHGRIVEVLGWPGEPGVEIASVIHRFGLATSFSDEVMAEVRDVPEEVLPKEEQRRENWRNRLVVTIDPADAKDHDDAIWCEKLPEGGWQLAVHIADVSHYVRPGTALDAEAAKRGNSTYLVDRVLPMLPPVLSNGICSLKPNVDRLTKCALMEISEKGEVKKLRVFDAVIHSQAKLSYQQAQMILDHRMPPMDSPNGVVQMVTEAWNLAKTMRQRRFSLGALNMEMPEVRVTLDEEGNACGVGVSEHLASHELVEECMLAANESVARLLKARQKPTMYRVHEEPDASRLEDFAQTARQSGYKPGDLTNRAHVQKLLDAAVGRPDEHAIKLGLLKSLKRAVYATEPLGHYGLAKGDYCHFTSPIRRYADLLVHRSLQPFLTNAPRVLDPMPPLVELRSVAQHLSQTERISSDAENETKQQKMMEFLERALDLKEPIVFEGLVTEVRAFGLLVELPDLGIRGAVRREDLPGSGWRLEGHRGAWVNWQREVIRVGMRLPLEVSGVNRERRFVDFRIAVNGSLPEDEGLAGMDSREIRGSRSGKSGGKVEKKKSAPAPRERKEAERERGGKSSAKSSEAREKSPREKLRGGESRRGKDEPRGEKRGEKSVRGEKFGKPSRRDASDGDKRGKRSFEGSAKEMKQQSIREKPKKAMPPEFAKFLTGKTKSKKAHRLVEDEPREKRGEKGGKRNRRGR